MIIFFSFSINELVANHVDIYRYIFYLNYFGINIYIFTVLTIYVFDVYLWIIDLYRWTSRLSDHNRFILLIGSSIIVVRLIIDGCRSCHRIALSIEKFVPISRSILSRAWNNLLTRERNKISNRAIYLKGEGVFISCLWIHRGRENVVILLRSSYFFTRGRNRVKDFIGQMFVEMFFLHIKHAHVFIAIFVIAGA